MKRLFFAICICMLCLFGCGSNTGDGEIAAADILPIEEVTQYIGYEPIAFESNTQLGSFVKYQSEAVGEGDPCEVQLYYPNKMKDAEGRKTEFDEKKRECEKHGALIEAESDAAQMFISIPSIYIYKNGCYVTITAGSGAGDEQMTLLKNLAELAASHIDECFPTDEE